MRVSSRDTAAAAIPLCVIGVDADGSVARSPEQAANKPAERIATVRAHFRESRPSDSRTSDDTPMGFILDALYAEIRECAPTGQGMR